MIKAKDRKKCLLACAAAFSIFVALFATYILVPRGRPLGLPDLGAFLESAQDGDIICILGNRYWSQVFKDKSFKDKRFSHLGIVRIQEGRASVIHSEGTTEFGKDFVKEEEIGSFIKHARAVGIYRTIGLDGGLVSSMAVEYIGAPFDWRFDMSDESKLYCTELLYVILKRLMPDLILNTVYLKELDREIIPLEAISQSESFSEIYCSK